MVNADQLQGNMLCSDFDFVASRQIQLKSSNCVSIVERTIIFRYKQYLARAVKNELQLDSTPSADMGEYTEESPKAEVPAVEQPKPAPLVSSPVRIGGGEAPAKPQPKGNLVVNASMLQTPKATTVSLSVID